MGRETYEATIEALERAMVRDAEFARAREGAAPAFGEAYDAWLLPLFDAGDARARAVVDELDRRAQVVADLTASAARVPRSQLVTCRGVDCSARSRHSRRADGSCVCPTCHEPYWRHPACANSELPESMQSSSLSRDYYLRVICNGDHVHL